MKHYWKLLTSKKYRTMILLFNRAKRQTLTIDDVNNFWLMEKK
jgi:hypothetical protein